MYFECNVLPKLDAIFNEFNLDLPAVTKSALGLSSILMNYWWLLILLFIVVLLLVLFAPPGRFARQEIARFLGLVRGRRSAGLLRLIAIASNAGRPISGALSTLARYHFDPTIRKKLLFVRNEIEQGADLWQSMKYVDLVTNADVRALDLAERVGNRSWVLSQLANAKNRRAARRMDRISQLMLPTIVVLMGMFVLFHAIALFSPLTHLIQGLAA
jgi:type II secretory pathway component PulF